MSAQSEENVDFLSTSNAFRGVSPEGLQYILSFAQELTYQAGEFVSQEGDLAQYVYFIKEGTVAVIKKNPDTGKEYQVATLSIGDSIGEFSLIENSPHAMRSASLCATSTTRVIAFSLEDLHSDKMPLSIYNTIVVNLARMLCQRLRSQNEEKISRYT